MESWEGIRTNSAIKRATLMVMGSIFRLECYNRAWKVLEDQEEVGQEDFDREAKKAMFHRFKSVESWVDEYLKGKEFRPKKKEPDEDLRFSDGTGSLGKVECKKQTLVVDEKE